MLLPVKLVLFSLPWSIPLNEQITIYLSILWRMDILVVSSLLDIRNGAAVNILVHAFEAHKCTFLLITIPSNGNAGSQGTQMFSFSSNCQTASKVVSVLIFN